MDGEMIDSNHEEDMDQMEGQEQMDEDMDDGVDDAAEDEEVEDPMVGVDGQVQEDENAQNQSEMIGGESQMDLEQMDLRICGDLSK